MFEGSPTPRHQQVIAGVALGVFASALLVMGVIGGVIIFKRGDWKTASTLLFTAFVVCGGGLVMAYRLVTARGVKRGGGVLSPTAYTILGWIFIALWALLFIVSIKDRIWKDVILSFIPILLAGWCFTAARFRGAMRDVPEWHDER